MSNQSGSGGGGIGCVGALTLLFVGLKLAEVGVVATWSWWWVLSPIWIMLGLVGVLIIGAFVIYLVAEYAK